MLSMLAIKACSLQYVYLLLLLDWTFFHRIRGTTDLRAEDLRQEGVSASLKQASLAFAQALESLSKASAIQEV